MSGQLRPGRPGPAAGGRGVVPQVGLGSAPRRSAPSLQARLVPPAGWVWRRAWFLHARPALGVLTVSSLSPPSGP